MDNPLDDILIDKISVFEPVAFDSVVYRATSKKANPTSPSLFSGRWAVPSSESFDGVQVLYTSLEDEGAKAELASFLSELTPLPKKKFNIHKIKMTSSKVIQLSMEDLLHLGVEINKYNDRDYTVTQKIGSVINFLEFDGLIAPSARWDCNNLMIYSTNHSINETVEVIETLEFDWQAWARNQNFI